MRRIIAALSVITFLFAGVPQAIGSGCVIDTTGSCATNTVFNYGKVCPAVLPSADGGVSYFESISFALPDSLSLSIPMLGAATVSVDEIIVSVTGFPEGLSFFCSNTNCTYQPSSEPQGCLELTGVPCDTSGDYTITVSFLPTVTLPQDLLGLTLQVPIPLTYELDLTLNNGVPFLEITSPTDFLCSSAPGLEVDLTASGGFASYVWSTGATTQAITVNTAGTYTLTATASNGCDIVESKEIQTLGASVSSDTTICSNEVLQLFASGGDDFSWTPTTNLDDATSASPVITNLTTTTTFTVTVSNDSCSDQASVTVTVDDNNCTLNCTACTINQGSCSGATPQLCGGSIASGTSGVAYDESATFFIPAVVNLNDVFSLPIDLSFLGLPSSFEVEDVVIDVRDLPTGFSWDCDQVASGCTYFPGLTSDTQYGCISVCGTSCEEGDFGTLVMSFRIPQQLQDILDNLNLPIPIPGVSNGRAELELDLNMVLAAGSALEITPSGPTDLGPGESVTLMATTGFTTYAWSDGSSTEDITVSTAGTYEVTATDANGCQQSEAIVVTSTSSVEDIVVNASLTIYPNPTDGQVVVDFSIDRTENITLEIMDLTGKIIRNRAFGAVDGKNLVTMNIADNASGIYVLKITTSQGVAIRKVSLL